MTTFNEWFDDRVLRENAENLDELLGILADAVEEQDWPNANQLLQQAQQAWDSLMQQAAELGGDQIKPANSPENSIWNLFKSPVNQQGIFAKYKIIDFAMRHINQLEQNQGFKRLAAVVGEKYNMRNQGDGLSPVNDFLHRKVLPMIQFFKDQAQTLQKPGYYRNQYDQQQQSAGVV